MRPHRILAITICILLPSKSSSGLLLPPLELQSGINNNRYTFIGYWNTYCKFRKSFVRRQNAVCAMTALMKYLHRRGDVPECYQLVLLGENVEILLDMRLSKTCTAFHSSVPLELKADEYLDALDDWKYMKSPVVLIPGREECSYFKELVGDLCQVEI